MMSLKYPGIPIKTAERMSNFFTPIFSERYGTYLCFGRLRWHQLRVHLHPSLYQQPIGRRFPAKKIYRELSLLCCDTKILGRKKIILRSWFISPFMGTRLVSLGFSKKDSPVIGGFQLVVLLLLSPWLYPHSRLHEECEQHGFKAAYDKYFPAIRWGSGDTIHNYWPDLGTL